MALEIETGAGVEGANSYVSLEEVRAYATARGLTVPVDDAALEALVIKAKDYLETKRSEFKGNKMYGPGYLQWPRSSVRIDGFEIADDAIPAELKDAQCQCAIDLQTMDPLAPKTGVVVKREKVDVIETEYAVSAGQTNPTPVLTKVDALLQPLLRWSGLRVDRA